MVNHLPECVDASSLQSDKIPGDGHDARRIDRSQDSTPHGVLAGWIRGMWQRGRLDLTMEHMLVQPPWNTLFSEEELKIAHQRLDAAVLDDKKTS
jgi:hypothetical protein